VACTRPSGWDMQMISFRTPFASLNPQMQLSDSKWPNTIHKNYGHAQGGRADKRILDAVDRVELRRSFMRRFPH